MNTIRDIVVVVVLLGFAGCAKSSRHPGDPADLSFRLEPEQQDVVLGEIVVIKRYVRNLSDHPIALTLSPARAITTFTHTDANGTKTSRTDPVQFQPSPKYEGLLLVLPGGEAFIAAAEYDSTYFDRPGEWRIVTEHRYPSVEENLAVAAFAGTLKSSEATVNIKEKKSPTTP